MLCQNFESVLVPYRTLADMANEPRRLPNVTYHDDILGADGFECITRVTGLFFETSPGAYTDSGRIVVSGQTAQRWWPGWGLLTWQFDAETGAFLQRGSPIGGNAAQAMLLDDVYQGAGTDLWVKHSYGHVYLIDHEYQPVDVILTPAFFGVSGFAALMVDRMRNRVVLANTSGSASVRVHDLATGALLSEVVLPSMAIDICHEEGTRCYVLTSSRDIFVLDYADGRLLGAVKITPLVSLLGVSSGAARIAWDKRYRRLIAIEQPDPPAGFSSTTSIYGFAMRPVATHLCAPIPLKRLRAGESVPVLVKAVGDLGDGIPAGVGVSVAGPALSAPRNVVALNGAGEGVVAVDAVTAGSDTLSLSMDVPCQL